MGRLRFCAECGSSNVPLHENFCEDCYWRFNNIGKLKKKRVDLPYCLECGSIKLTSGWTGPNYKEEIPETIAYAHFGNLSTAATSIIEIADITDVYWLHPNPDFVITYRVINEDILEFPPHEEFFELEVKIHGGTCSTCIKRKTGSGEVTVQFRAKNRKITQDEMDTATTIAFTHASSMSYESQEAYLSDIVESYGGLDFYFGNDAIAEAFIESIKSKWIGHYEKNFKLVTEDKDEKRIYAVTHLFRLPEVQIGDFIEYEEELHLVKNISKGGVHLFSLISGRHQVTKDWKDLRPLDPKPRIERNLVVSEDIEGNSYLIMDLNNYETKEVSRGRFPQHLEISKEIDFIVWNEELYLQPPLDKEVR